MTLNRGIILAAAVTAAGALVQASTAPAGTAPVNAVRLPMAMLVPTARRGSISRFWWTHSNSSR